ncbi:hypothetical protein HY004_02800 [Candidatus Saccharibacteria bacterium]|nr:hypothetical protein [Candidatus Saccharibacteria bacterium]
MEKPTRQFSNIEIAVLHRLQDEHDEDAEPDLAIELVELACKLDNDTLLHLCCEAEIFIGERELESALGEPDPELEAKIHRLYDALAKLYQLIDVMPSIDRDRAIKLYERGLDNELEYRFHAGSHISMCLDSIGMSEDTVAVWQVALLSNQPKVAEYARASYKDIMYEQELMPSDVPNAINKAYRVSNQGGGSLF